MDSLIPYKGSDSFIFISYSHKDSDVVYPILAKLQTDGYRFWFDKGIEPGENWDEVIASKIEACSFFISFVSKNYLESDNCPDEFGHARNYKKKPLLLYLEDVELPSGMAMRSNRSQSIFKYKYTAENEFFKTLYSAKGINKFKSTVLLNPATADAETPDKAKTDKYIFVSYAPEEKKIVMPILKRLEQDGYRVKWSSNLIYKMYGNNEKLYMLNCERIVAFISKNYLKNKQSKKELGHVWKNDLLVFLEDVKMPSTFANRTNLCKTISKYDYASDNEFYNALCTSSDIGRYKKTSENATEVASYESKYEGETQNGVPHGKGVYTWADGSSYDGDWLYGKRTGKGTHISANGDRYEGDFLDGKRHGIGTAKLANGELYIGEFTDDKFDGSVTVYFPDGTSEDRVYEKGKRIS